MLRLKVPDMSCGHCVGAIEQAVRRVDPAATVTADLPAGTVAVATVAEAAAIIAALAGAGYPARPA